MANVNAAHGLVPLRHLTGAAFDGQANTYELAATDATTVFIGDMVKLATGSNSIDGTPLVTAHNGTSDIPVGVVVAIMPVLTNLAQKSHLASTQQRVLVVDSPDVVFEIQSNGTLAAADIGKFASVTANNTGSVITGLSLGQLLESSVTATPSASLPLMLVGIRKSADNAFGASGVAEVLLINHAYRTGSGT